MMSKKRFWWMGGGCLLILLGSFAFRIKDKYFEIAKNLDLMAAVYRNLNAYYVDSTDPSRLMGSAIHAMTRHLDPYTVFYPEGDVAQLDFETTGQYAGIGAAFRIIHDSVFISALFPDAPFAKAGFKPGDIILSLNGTETTGLSSEEVHALLEGKTDSKLEVAIKRPWDAKIIRKTVKREMISVSAIPYKTILSDHVGYICFRQFTRGSAKEFENAFRQFKEEDTQLSGLIIDLRGNPGGLLGEAVKMSNLFLPVGDTIVTVKGRSPSWNAVYTATNKPLDTLIPIAVLINGGTASAAEIFAGAMQDMDRAVIFGQQSFGKGLVQITRELPYNARLKLTVARYYTPSGRCIQAIDYKHDNAYGGPVQIADSLQEIFNTADGRIVKNNGGISPDSVMINDYTDKWSAKLLNDHVFFRFATQYVYQHPTAPPLGNFEITDSLFSAFLDYTKTYPVAYGSGSEVALERFRSNALREGYFDSVKVIYDSLSQRVSHYTHPKPGEHRKEAAHLLATEIMNCYYVQAGKIAMGIIDDNVVNTAAAVLIRKEKYRAILE